MQNFYQWLEARPTVGGFGDVFGLHGMRWNTPEESNMWNIVKNDPEALAAYKRVVSGSENDHEIISHGLKKAYEMAIQKHMPYTPGMIQTKPQADRPEDNWGEKNTNYTEPQDYSANRRNDVESPEAKAERYRQAAQEQQRREILARRGNRS